MFTFALVYFCLAGNQCGNPSVTVPFNTFTEPTQDAARHDCEDFLARWRPIIVGQLPPGVTVQCWHKS